MFKSDHLLSLPIPLKTCQTHLEKGVLLLGIEATFLLAPAPLLQCTVEHCSEVLLGAGPRSSSQVSQDLLSRCLAVEGDIQCEPWDPQYVSHCLVGHHTYDRRYLLDSAHNWFISVVDSNELCLV